MAGSDKPLPWLTVGFAGVTVLLVLSAFTDLRPLLPELLRGLKVTVLVTLGAALLAVLFALTAAVAKLYAPRPIRWLSILYVEVFRGTSALIQLFWLFFVLPLFGLTFSAYTVGIVALGLNIGAYGAEVIRGAILSVPRGQWEAAGALNMSRMTALRRIVLPQAFPAMIPPWGNLFIELLKATALVSLITLDDLSFKAQQLNQSTLRTVEVFSLTLLFYLGLALIITAVMRWLERRIGRNLSRGRSL